MTYRSGDLQFHDHEHGPECRDAEGDVASWTCTYIRDHPQVTLAGIEELRRVAYLPHSCEEWEIGGPDEVRRLLTDLFIVYTRMRGEPERDYVMIPAGEEIKEGAALVIRDGKVYRA